MKEILTWTHHFKGQTIFNTVVEIGFKAHCNAQMCSKHMIGFF